MRLRTNRAEGGRRLFGVGLVVPVSPSVRGYAVVRGIDDKKRQSADRRGLGLHRGRRRPVRGRVSDGDVSAKPKTTLWRRCPSASAQGQSGGPGSFSARLIARHKEGDHRKTGTAPTPYPAKPRPKRRACQNASARRWSVVPESQMYRSVYVVAVSPAKSVKDDSAMTVPVTTPRESIDFD